MRITQEEAQQELNRLADRKTASSNELNFLSHKLINVDALYQLKEAGFFADSSSADSAELFNLGFRKIGNIEAGNESDSIVPDDVLINADEFVKSGCGPHLTVREYFGDNRFVSANIIVDNTNLFYSLEPRIINNEQYDEKVYDITIYFDHSKIDISSSIDIYLEYHYEERE